MSVVRVSRDDGVAQLVLDSPANRNALSIQLRNELYEALRNAAGDSSVRCVVLTHAGTVFCSGADLKEARSEARNEVAASFTDILTEIWRMPKPVVAAVSGAARAGGLGLMAACDLVIACSTVTFACTEVSLGVVPAVISAVILPRMIPASAHRLFLTGMPVSAHSAASAGLVDVVADPPDVEAVVRQHTDSFRHAAPEALAATKALTRSTAAIERLSHELADLDALSKRHFSSAEGREGIAAFIEKRAPWWAEG
jgi:methylglutaconyl-CoA hydratase